MSKMKMEDALMEMSSWEICRICGGNDCDLVPIYDENGITLQLEEKINHYLPITVSQEDELPLYMCVPCIEKLNTTHELIVICLEADEKLKELLHLKKKYLELNVSKLRKEAKAFTIKNNGIVYEKESVETSIENEDSLQQSCQASSMAPLSECEKESEETSILIEDSVQQGCQASSMAPLSELEDSEAPELNVKEEEEDDPVSCDPETDLEDKKEVEPTADITDLLVPKEYKDEEYDTADEVKEEIIMDYEEDEIKTVLLVNGYSGAESGEQSQCRYCRQVCDDLETHLQSSVCEYCGTHFACPGTLQVHEQLQHQKEHFRCTIPGCYKKYQDKSKLEEHAAQHAVDEPWLCDVCGRSFVTATTLRSHYRSHQEVPKEHKCSMCPKLFRSRFNLRKHMMSHTGEKPFLCECCSKRFASKETLKQHLVIHSREKPFKCTMCPFSTVRRGNLAKHYETHADAKFECKICHKSFATRYDLQNHHYTHTDEELTKIIELEGPGMLVCRTFRCDQCGKFLSSKASLVIHQRMHSGDRPFQCSQCGKRFSQKPSLDYHVRLHTGERPHQCIFCGQGFNSKAAKESHERVHTGEKPYRCNTCSAKFRNCANLRQHQLIHNDSREHPCSVCGKRFRRREAVQVHMRVHTGERPYSCPLCLKKFTQKGDQLKHTRAHIMKNDRRCSFCGKEFPNRRELKQHSCERKIVADTHHFDTVLLNPTQLIANTEITVVTAEMPDTP